MARPKTPTNVLEMRGAFKNHPERKKQRTNEPQPDKIKATSRHLSTEEKKIRKEILTAIPTGVAYASDDIALEVLTKLVYKMRFNFDSMSAAEIGRLETLLGRFGMTPSDRSKVIVKKEENKNDPWANL